jgi:signal transduction histidine kinase
VSDQRQPIWPNANRSVAHADESWDSPLFAPGQSERAWLIENSGKLPCVLFEAKPSLQLVSASENITEALGVKMAAALEPGFLIERVAAEDRPRFREGLAELESSGAVSFLHRFIQGSGLPVWAALSLRKLSRENKTVIHGCLVPLAPAPRLFALEQEVIARFIHKLGNQFQLLGLVIASLQDALPKSRESSLLQEALDKAIDLTRILADCNQIPSWPSAIQLLEVLRAAADGRAQRFKEEGADLRVDFAEISEDVFVPSSPYLLEAAFGNILENALEATGAGGIVQFGGRLELHQAQAVAVLHIRDTGCGMSSDAAAQALLPFFTTKKGRDGLGLAIASRFLEMHGGLVRIRSEQGRGTEVTILLPVDRTRDPLCS